MTIMSIPFGFKIKKKTDAYIFMRDCMHNGNTYYVEINNELAIWIEKKQTGTVSILEKRGDLYDPFNPLLEIANTSNIFYKETVQDYIWKYRKYINAKWFND